jgi:hypothetical protein
MPAGSEALEVVDQLATTMNVLDGLLEFERATRSSAVVREARRERPASEALSET